MKGMGAGLFDRFPARVESANEVLGYDLRELCLEDPRGLLDDTRYTQPAIYVVNALSYEDSLERGEPSGDYLLGHSLGEYNALHAAGVFDFETGLKLVVKRGELMARSRDGAMLAVVGITGRELDAFLLEEDLSGLDVANYNTDAQTVLSGPGEDIDRARRLLEERRVRVARLKVSAAFHSRLMVPARDEFTAFLKGFRFRSPTGTVIANLTARPYSGDAVAETLSEQICGSVRWVESVRYMLARTTVDKCREVGNGSVLTRMLDHIDQSTTPDRGPDGGSRPRPRLFCAAYAGGDERSYAALAEECPDLEVLTLERPGRGSRVSEPLLTSPEAVVEDMLTQIRERLDAPYALYGHSLGAGLVYLLCRRLREEGLPAPLHLFVSGASGPSVRSREYLTWTLESDAFWEHLRRLGGVPAELLKYEDMKAFYEPILRADFTILGSYEHRSHEPMDLPVTVFVGEDEDLPNADVDAWQRETQKPLETHVFPGGHFFIRSHWADLARIIAPRMSVT
ncbi:hypothetical protein DSY14_01225 [Nocardiopsis sp. MG754419]|nr:hypothetical protein [Nocardiopsis sp. MG754419]